MAEGCVTSDKPGSKWLVRILADELNMAVAGRGTADMVVCLDLALPGRRGKPCGAWPFWR
jgi:hypothetical protein